MRTTIMKPNRVSFVTPHTSVAYLMHRELIVPHPECSGTECLSDTLRFLC